MGLGLGQFRVLLDFIFNLNGLFILNATQIQTKTIQ